MGRIAATHRSEFDAIRALCYQGLDSARFREQVGDRLAHHLGISSYCFGALDPSTSLPMHSVSVGLDPTAMQSFFGLMLTTPSLDFGPWVRRSKRVARHEDLVDDINSDPYMTEILRPSGLQHDIQFACVSGGWSWGHACLRRTAKEGPFLLHEVRFLESLVAHFGSALRSAATRAAVNASSESETGIVVLGPDGKVELANAVAERFFRQPVSGTRHCFLTGVHIAVAQLERMLSEERGADRGIGQTVPSVPSVVMIDEVSQRAYRLRAERTFGADGRWRGLVIIEPNTAPAAGQQMQALAQYGLTPRECNVAISVLQGRSEVEIGAELFLSVHTVHDHVRSVFTKLSVTSRQQLAIRLLGG
jgi:DNA-binding CsgD family transcriptional regulator/GAF domain-containing protein